MEKNFDGDTRQLHEENIQLKIEVEHMRKEVEQQRKLLQEARIKQQKTEENHERVFLEWKTQFEHPHNCNLEQNELKDIDTVEKKEEVNISEMCKEAFGVVCSPSQTDISESTQSDIEVKEKRLEDTVTTLQRLDKLQQEELVELRKMAQEKQSNLNNYVAKVKQLQEQQQFVTDNTCSKLPKEVVEKDSSDTSSQGGVNVQSCSRMNSPELAGIDTCPVCGDNAKTMLERETAANKKNVLKRDKAIQGLSEMVYRSEKEVERLKSALTEKEQNTKMLLETEVAASKKQMLKRDKIIQGMTEIVFKKEKEIERLNVAVTEKESIEQVITKCANAINIAVENTSSFDKVKAAVQEIAISLMKVQSKFDTNRTKQLPEYVLKSLERNFVQWIFDLANNSKSCDKRNVEVE